MLILSKSLSAIFRICLAVILIYTIGTITAQISKKEISIPIKNSRFYLGHPGIDLSFTRHNNQERMAPDTLISFYSINTHGDTLRSKMSTSHPLFQVETSHKVPLDTTITTIRDDYESFYETDSLMEYHTNGTFNKREVNHKLVFGKITEQSSPAQILRVQPRTTGQYIYFIIYDIIWFGSIIVLLFLGIRMFSNLGKRDFFNEVNSKLFRFAGLFLLIPQALKLFTFILYSGKLNPGKAVIEKGDFSLVAQYSLNLDLNIPLIIVGVLLILLTYVFKSGTLIQEDNSLMI